MHTSNPALATKQDRVNFRNPLASASDQEAERSDAAGSRAGSSGAAFVRAGHAAALVASWPVRKSPAVAASIATHAGIEWPRKNQRLRSGLATSVVPESVQCIGGQQKLRGADHGQRESAEQLYVHWARLNLDVDGPLPIHTKNDLSSETIRGCHHIIHPDWPFRQGWDILQIMFLAQVALLTPFEIGFDRPDPVLWSTSFFVHAIVDIYFIADIWMSFCTAFFYAENKIVDGIKMLAGELEIRWGKIAKRYVRGWFLIDILSSLPISYIVYFLPSLSAASENSALDTDDMANVELVKLIRLLRLFKLLRLARLKRLMQQYEAVFYSLMQRLKIAKLILYIMITSHWLCCAWFYVGSMNHMLPTGQVQAGWVAQSFASCSVPFVVDYGSNAYCGVWNMTQSLYTPVADLYTMSMYHALNTIIGATIPATTQNEIIFGSISITIGGFLFGNIIGNLTELIRKANYESNLGSKALAQATAICRLNVDEALTVRIHEYMSTYQKHRPPLDELELLVKLPSSLMNEFASQMGWTSIDVDGNIQHGILHKIPFLSSLDMFSQIVVCSRMKVMEVSKEPADGEEGKPKTITTEGQIGADMFIVMEGEIVVQKEGTVLGSLQEHDFFGELAALLAPTRGLWGRKYIRTTYPRKDSVVAMLSYEDIVQCRRDRPQIDHAVGQYVQTVSTNLRLAGSDQGEEIGNDTACVSVERQLARVENRLGTRMSRVEAQLEKLTTLLENMSVQN
eukprot:SAG31_NODE_996_length_10492_cov_4.648802_1_plen_739_part_00